MEPLTIFIGLGTFIIVILAVVLILITRNQLGDIGLTKEIRLDKYDTSHSVSKQRYFDAKLTWEKAQRDYEDKMLKKIASEYGKGWDIELSMIKITTQRDLYSHKSYLHDGSTAVLTLKGDVS